MRLKNKVALISGGGTGIGKATALLFSREGAKVAISGRRKEPLEETVSEINTSGGKAVLIQGDVSVVKEAKAMVDKSAKAFGRLDILVNNAGVDYKPGNIPETEEEEWDVTMDINVKGVYLLSKFAVPELEKTRGNIINISSVIGMVGCPGAIAYTTSKGAVLNLTRSMAIDLAPRIRVNCICPGIVDTPMARRWIGRAKEPEALLRKVLEDYPLGRMGQPEDIAYAALYFASEEAGWVTGAVLPVDGGFTAG